MFYFRFHRGGFIDSLSTEVSFDNLFDLYNYIVNHFKCFSIHDIHLKYYSFDKRLKSNCFICYTSSFNGEKGTFPIGFLYNKKGT